MVLGGHPQHFHSQMLESHQQFGTILQQKLGIRSLKFHHDFGVLEIGVYVLPFRDFERQSEAGILKNRLEKALNTWTYAGNLILFLVHPYLFEIFFCWIFGASITGAGVYLLIKNCCAMPTRLPVSQYNTRPLDML